MADIARVVVLSFLAFATAAILGAMVLTGFSEALHCVNQREAFFLTQAEQASDTRARVRAHLQKLYIENGELIAIPLAKDITAKDFQDYVNHLNGWISDSANWIAANLVDQV